MSTVAPDVWKKARCVGASIYSPVIAAVLWIMVFGGSVVMVHCVSTTTKSEEEKEEDEASSQEASIRRNERCMGLLTISPRQFLDRFSRTIFERRDLLRPIIGVTLVLYFLFDRVTNKVILLPGVEDFTTTCPGSGRRTQSSALVKLLAASVTTVGIHGHLGSLAGSESWRRELFRAVEVVLFPLASVYAFAMMVWVEIADIFNPGRSFWLKAVGTRYRLARMCMLRTHTDASNHEPRVPPYLASINPDHLDAQPLRYDLKWAGRTIILIVLLGQYVQAFVLLSRRFMTKTSAMVDVAMILMVVSGGGALIQSLLISLTNTAWVIRTDAPPCVARSCMRGDCWHFKKDTGRPNASSKTTMLGFDVTGIPRTILLEFLTGYFQFQLVVGIKHTLWDFMYTVFGLYCIWRMTLYMLVSVDLTNDLGSDKKTDGDPIDAESQQLSEAEVLPVVQPSANSGSGGLVPSTAPRTSFLRGLATLLPTVTLSAIFLAIGCVILAFGCFCIVGHFFYLTVPWVLMYSRVFQETGDWKNWNVTEPCPMMWKDSLEDELWWF